jgi:hypothetical protein
VPGNHPYAIKWQQSGGMSAPLTVTYSFSNLLDGRLGGGLSATTIRATIQEALSRWAAVAPLNFVEVRDVGPAPADAEYDPTGMAMMRFGHRSLDGGYGILAYGYYPGYSGLSGDIHFDTSERWTVNPDSGQDLLEVATHEIGHALGLGHSYAAQSIMTAMYGGYFNGPGTSFLYQDDINGIRALYGAGQGSVRPIGPNLPPGQTFVVLGTTLFVQGTNGSDTFVFNGSTGRVSLNSSTYSGNLNSISVISFDGQGGYDRSFAVGTSDSEIFALRPGQLTLTGPRWSVGVANSEQIDVTAGWNDQATITDSMGNDHFSATPTIARLMGNGFDLIARSFDMVTVQATGGVMDRAWLYDSSGDDTFVASPTLARLFGYDYSNKVLGFDAVYAFATSGADSTKLYDSAGADVFVSRTTYAMLTAQNSSYLLIGYGFEGVQAFSTGGFDLAYLYDTASDDVFIGTPTYSSLQGGGFRWEVANFDQAYAISNSGGNDSAYLYDSAGNDTFVANGGAGTLYYPYAAVQFVNFRYASLYGTAGGVNRRPWGSFGYWTDWNGTWV